MKVLNVISIVEYRDQDTISTLTRLLEKAKAGEISGFIYAAKVYSAEKGIKEIGVTGDYRKDPASGLCAVGRAFGVLSQLMRKITWQVE